MRLSAKWFGEKLSGPLDNERAEGRRPAAATSSPTVLVVIDASTSQLPTGKTWCAPLAATASTALRVERARLGSGSRACLQAAGKARIKLEGSPPERTEAAVLRDRSWHCPQRPSSPCWRRCRTRTSGDTVTSTAGVIGPDQAPPASAQEWAPGREMLLKARRAREKPRARAPAVGAVVSAGLNHWGWLAPTLSTRPGEERGWQWGEGWLPGCAATPAIERQDFASRPLPWNGEASAQTTEQAGEPPAPNRCPICRSDAEQCHGRS